MRVIALLNAYLIVRDCAYSSTRTGTQQRLQAAQASELSKGCTSETERKRNLGILLGDNMKLTTKV